MNNSNCEIEMYFVIRIETIDMPDVSVIDYNDEDKNQRVTEVKTVNVTTYATKRKALVCDETSVGVASIGKPAVLLDTVTL